MHFENSAFDMKRRTREHQKRVEKLVKAFKKLHITSPEERISLSSNLFERLSIATYQGEPKRRVLGIEINPCPPQKS